MRFGTVRARVMTVVLALAASAAVAQPAAPVVQALVNQASFQPGQTLTLGASVTNPGGGGSTDFYVGIQLPDGLTAVMVRLGAAPVAGSLGNLAALPPTAAGVNLAGAFAVNQPALLTYTFTGAEPPGTYTAFVAAVSAGALRDGALGPGEMQAFSTATFTTGVGSTTLTGAPSSPALDATTTFIGGDRVPPSAISTEASGIRIARTQLEVAFVAGATVGEVNAAIAAVNGRIVSMLRGVLILLIEIPDPGDLAGLDAVRSRLATQPGVRTVELAQFAATSNLPPQYSTTSADLPKIDHLIATRVPAAWNTVAALTGATRPLMLVGDFFGGGAPGALFDATVTATDYDASTPQQHGYHVLGTIVGTFAGDTSAAGLVTGLLPGTSTVRSVDGSSALSVPAFDNRLVQIITAHSGNVVLNTSLGSDCRTPAAAARNCVGALQQTLGAAWLERVRGTANVGTAGVGVERKFLHAVSAGNIEVTGDLDASTSGPYAAAALLAGKTNGAALVPDAVNTLVVENLVNEAGSPFRPDCLSFKSKRLLVRNAVTDLVNVSAPGTDIWSMLDSASAAGDFSGTSMASPQVAALAAWVWALRPTLTPRQVMLIITRTARRHPVLNLDARCSATSAPAPTIDTYAAVLGTDVGLTDAPVRLALFDVGGPAGPQSPDGFFDEADLAQFVQAFSLAGGALDYSRFDLNGDGNTGGAGQAPFDLDFDLTYQFAGRTQGGVTRTVDESAATDVDVLCHYAYSTLYSGSQAERSRLLGTLCSEAVFAGTATPRLQALAASNDTPQQSVLAAVNAVTPDLVITDAAGTASVRGMVNQLTMTTDSPTAKVMSGTMQGTARAANAARASANFNFLYVVQMPSGRNGQATFSTTNTGGFPGSLDIQGLGASQAIGGRDITVTVPLLAGEVYRFTARHGVSANGPLTVTSGGTMTYSLDIRLTP